MSARKKKKAENLSLFNEAEDAQENKNALAQTSANNDQGLTEPEFVRMEKNIAAFGFFTPASKRSKETPPKVIKFTQIIDGNRAEAKVTIAGNTLYGMPTTADQDKYLAFQKNSRANQKGKRKNRKSDCFYFRRTPSASRTHGRRIELQGCRGMVRCDGFDLHKIGRRNVDCRQEEIRLR